MYFKNILLPSLLALSILSGCSQTGTSYNNNFNNQVTLANASSVLSDIDTALGEVRAPNEARDIKAIEDAILATVKKAYKEPPVKRDVHTKHHGCPKAFFKVDNSNIPAEYRVGVFAQNKEYPAWIRFSNGSGDGTQPDSKGDVRGFAVKLMNVPGRKLLPAEANEQTQDFLLMNNSFFFIRELSDYVGFSKAVAKGGLGVAWFMLTHPRSAKIVLSIFAKKIANPLETEFFSATAYKLGNTAVKYKVQPCDTSKTPMPKNPGPDYLREAMTESLSNGNSCFDFMVQFHKGSFKEMPVEDATIDWDQKKSPYVKVARINITSQKFDSPQQMNFCENLSFTPWHSLPEHKPLGSANRARKTVYELISKYRHQMNGAVRKEPVSHNIF